MGRGNGMPAASAAGGLRGQGRGYGSKRIQADRLKRERQQLDRAVSTVTVMLDSRDVDERDLAVGLAGALGDPQLIDALRRRTQDEEDTIVAERALEALGEIGGPQARQAIRALAAGDTYAELDGGLFADALAAAQSADGPSLRAFADCLDAWAQDTDMSGMRELACELQAEFDLS